MRIATISICVVIIGNILSNIDIAALSVAVYDAPKCVAVSVDADKGIIVLMMTTMVVISIKISDTTAIDYDDDYYENNNVDKYNYCADDD